MIKSTLWLSMLLTTFLAASCTTNDVDSPIGGGVDTTSLYQIQDAAFAHYLIYNSGLAAGSANALPAGIALKQDGNYYINKEIAKTATAVYLVKDSIRMLNLEKGGVPTAKVKIVSIDGIQFFTSTKELKLTSNAISNALDVSMLIKLETLEMNGNYVNSLTIPASIKRLRYSASLVETAPDNRWLTSINLAACSALNHLFLINHHITEAGLVLPTSYASLKEMDLTGNSDAPFFISSDLWTQLTIRNGVKEKPSDNYNGPIPKESYYEILDLAFGEYLVYLTNTEPDASLKLPAGTAIKYTNNKLYIKKSIAATATSLNISKASSFSKKLTDAGVPSAGVKIADADGIQFFTGLKTLVATSNAFTEPLQLTALTSLTSLTVRTAGLSKLDISANTKLTVLDIQGSTAPLLGRLQAVDLSKNTALVSVNLSANEIDPTKFVLPASYPDLKTLNMGSNKVEGEAVTFTVPAVLYKQLGTGKDDKTGLVSGS